MGWLSNLLFPCSQARKPSKAPSFQEKPQPTPEEQRQKLSPIDTTVLPQKPNRLVKKPTPASHRASIRIVEYPDSDSMLDDFDEKYRPQTSCADTESVFSDDRTIMMPGPEEEAVLLEMSKIEKDLASTPFSTPRRTSVTTTRTSACLDNILPLDAMSPIKEEVEQESEEPRDTLGVAVTSSPDEEEEKVSKPEVLHYETPKAYQEPQEHQEQQVHQEEEKVPEPEPEQGPQPQPEPEPKLVKQQERDSHLSQLSTRLSRRRSLIEIFNLLHTNERSSFKLNLDFSPRLYQNPLSPSSPCSSITAVSPPMSPVSTISPLSPTLSDETIEFDGIETACAVQIAAPKGPEAIVRQGRDIILEENPFRFH